MTEITINHADIRSRTPPKRVAPRRGLVRPLHPVGPPRRPGNGSDLKKIAAWTGVGLTAATGLLVGGKIVWDNTFGKPYEPTPPPHPTEQPAVPNSTPLPYEVIYPTATPTVSAPASTPQPPPTETHVALEYELVTDPKQALEQAKSFELVDVANYDPVANQIYNKLYPSNETLNIYYPFSIVPDRVVTENRPVTFGALTALAGGRFNPKYLAKLSGKEFSVTSFTFNNPTEEKPLVFQNSREYFGFDHLTYDAQSDTLYVEMGTDQAPYDLTKSKKYDAERMIYAVYEASHHSYGFLGESNQPDVILPMVPNGQSWTRGVLRKDHRTDPNQPPSQLELLSMWSDVPVTVETFGFYQASASNFEYSPIQKFPFAMFSSHQKDDTLMFVQNTLPKKE